MKSVCAAVVFVCLVLLCPLTARGEDTSLDEGIEALPLTELQQSADESGLGLDVRDMIKALTSGGLIGEADELMAWLRERAAAAVQAALPSLLTLTAPALLWALSRQLAGGALSAPADMVCYLAEAGALTAMFSQRMAAARLVTGRLSALIGRFHPLAAFVLSAAGRVSSASLMRPAGALAVSLVSGGLTQATFALSACMAALTVIGHLSERLRLDAPIRLCKRLACCLLGGAATLFLGVMKADSLLESGRDDLAMRAAEYAVDKLLPVIGGDVADTLGTLASGTALIRSAVGVTGTVLMLALCLEPVLALLGDILCCRLAAALSEPVASGPLTRCLNGFADAMQLLLLIQVACAALFLILAGTLLRGV